MIEGKPYLIPNDEVHIWSTSLLGYDKELAYLASLLSEDEQERARKFRFLKDQRRFIVARSILRCLLSSYLSQFSPERIEIVYGLWGKPILRDEKLLHFNLSHSQEYVLYAFTNRCEVGIDLEYIDRNFNIEEIIFSTFTLEEQKYWEALNSEDKIHEFFRIWTCKEAYLKALGKGWLENTMEISFIEKTFLKKRIKNNNSIDNIYSCYFDCIPEYASAISIKGLPLRRVHFTYAPNYLQRKKKLNFK